VSTLKGQYVQVTGRIHVDGVWWTQAEVKQKVRQLGGAFVVKGSRNKEQTFVTAGELPLHVIDPKNRRSQNIVFGAKERALGNHICLVDEHGFGQLLQVSAKLAQPRRSRYPVATSHESNAVRAL
jgi:hypothetical protein